MRRFISLIIRNIITFVIVVVFVSVIDFLLLSIHYSTVEANFTKGFEIHGLDDYNNPQGIYYSQKYNVVLQTSYNSKKKEASFFLLNPSSGAVTKELRIKNSDGSDYVKKASGLASDENKVWVSSDYEVLEFAFSDIIGSQTDSVRARSATSVILKADFCYYNNGKLWIGEYGFKPFVKVNHDLPLMMSFDANSNFTNPDTVISLPNMTRDMMIIGDEFFITRSSNNYMISFLESYKIALGMASDTFAVNGENVPYYHFENSSRERQITLPSLAKGMYLVTGNINIIFENGSRKYFYSFPKIKTTLRYDISK